MTAERDLNPDARAPWLDLVGIGESGWAGLAEDARAAVTDARLLVGGERHLAMVPERAGQQRMSWPRPIKDGIRAILDRRGEAVCVLASGDPFCFGIGATLSRHLPAAEMRALPAPSAFSLAAARLGWPLQAARCLSIHGRDPQALRAALAPGRRLLVLTGDGHGPALIASLLREAGYGASRMVAFEAMGGPQEARHAQRAADWPPAPIADLNTVAIECRCEPPQAAVPLTPGRDEARFAHDGQISKQEIRALILAQLGPRGGECLWDVGAGSGAVAVEWLLADTANRAVAVEADHARLQRAADNAAAFGVGGALTTQHGRAPQALAGLPAPDAVFIGGGLTTPGLLDACWAALPAHGRCVATAVTLEGEAALTAARARLGGRLIRLSVERAEPLGRYHGWQPLRPVTLWNATRQPSTTKEDA